MAQEADNKVPEVRFSQFTDDWVEMPMAELLSFKNGYNAGGEQYGTGEKFINVLDIIENDYITHDRIIGRVDISKDDFKKNEVNYGDILFQRSSETREEVGQANVYLDENTPATFGGFVIRGKPINEFDSVFFNAMLKTAKARAEITARSGGSTRYNIGQESLEDALVTIALDLSEQKEIAAFWMSLDRLIELHQSKYDKLVTLKQAMLQKMFPQDGATTPEIRFKGFEGDWIDSELENEVEFFSGLTYSPRDVREKGGTLVLRSSNVKNGQLVDADNVYVSSTVVGCEQVRVGDIAVVVRNGSRSLIGKHAPVVEQMNDTVIGAFMTGIRSSQSNFINAILSTAAFMKQINKNTGATINQITTGVFKRMCFSFPEPEEQEQVGTYFRNLDKLISKHSTQIEKLKNIKSACLEKMFV